MLEGRDARIRKYALTLVGREEKRIDNEAVSHA